MPGAWLIGKHSYPEIVGLSSPQRRAIQRAPSHSALFVALGLHVAEATHFLGGSMKGKPKRRVRGAPIWTHGHVQMCRGFSTTDSDDSPEIESPCSLQSGSDTSVVKSAARR